MGKLKAGMASSHAFAVTDPSQWDQMRTNNRRSYEKNYGVLPPDHPRVAEESDDDVRKRYGVIEHGFGQLRAKLEEIQPDAIVMVADDQNENFTDTIIPQFAIYIGDDFIAGRLVNEGWLTKSNAQLAEALAFGLAEADVDISVIRELPNHRLFAHAFGPVLKVVDPEAKIPVVPIFVNAIHMPATSPHRCYYVGQVIRKVVEEFNGVERVVVYGSGGLSHFTAGYPWKHYEGPFGYGSISEEFDHNIIEKMKAGRGEELAKLTIQDLIAHGEIELRSWISVLGAIGSAKPDLMVYEPLYRGVMGMAVASWPVAEAA